MGFFDNLGGANINFQALQVFIIPIIVIVLVALFGLLMFFMFKKKGIYWTNAWITTQDGKKCYEDIIRKVWTNKDKKMYEYVTQRSKMKVFGLEDRYIRSFKPMRFMDQIKRRFYSTNLVRVQLPNGTAFCQPVQYFEKIVVPPSNEPQVLDYGMAPESKEIISFALEDADQDRRNFSDFLEKNKWVLPTMLMGIFVIGFVFLIIGMNMIK